MKRMIGIGIITALMMVAGCNNKDKQKFEYTRVRTTAQLKQFMNCNELLTAMQTSLKEEMRIQLESISEYYRGYMVGDGTNAAPEASDGAASDGKGGAGLQEGVDYSGTNNQEAGVDEADFVKTDGENIYVLNGARLEIFGSYPFGTLTAKSTTELEGYPYQMLIGDNFVVAFSYIYTYQLPTDHPLRQLLGVPMNCEGNYNDGCSWWYYSPILTKFTVLDVSDRSAPTLVRELYLEGYYQTGRRVEQTVRMINYAWLDIPGLVYWPELPDSYWYIDWQDPDNQALLEQAIDDAIAQNNELIDNLTLDDFVPALIERVNGEFTIHSFNEKDCHNFSMADDGISHGITSILSMNLNGQSFNYEADHIVTNYSTVYASKDVLLLAEPAQDWWWFWGNDNYEEATNIHRFDISSPNNTVYTGSGRIAGLTLDQFSLSEYQGYVRAATTTGQWNRWWMDDPEPMENHVFVLAGDASLETIGHLGGIAKDERIWASRFVEDKAYLVTFQWIDPLWIIDLADPAAPVVVSSLEVPGVSTYIHPLDGHLLTIGYGSDDDGFTSWWNTQLSLFDVTDITKPIPQSKLTLSPPSPNDGWSYSWSEATWEHKAFQYWNGMLAIPLTSYRYISSCYDQPRENYYDCYEWFSQLKLLTVDLEGGITPYATIDHSDFFNNNRDYYWWYNDVRRSIFMGKEFESTYIYAISDKGITAHKLSDMTPVAQAELPGTTNEQYWWY